MTGFALDDLPAPLGQILHVGAGSGGDMPRWLASGASAITLVEPDPEALAALREALDGNGNGNAKAPPVALVAAALSAARPPALLHRFSFPDLSSLSPATAALQGLYPGLRSLASEPVALRDPADLVAGLGLAEGRCHVLVLEAPGQAQAILSALAQAGRLAAFARLVVQEGEAVLYEGQSPLAAIAAWLEGQGYALRIDRTADPDRPHLVASRDIRGIELAEARAALAARAADLARAVQERDAAVKERDAARRERDAAVKERDAAKAERDAVEAERRAQAADHAGITAAQEARLARAKAELLKAEGQIEFISALLLNGQPT